ncbi:MAG: 1,2-phenylacetyl-CoA epoxidase subunit A [Ardenticatenaceae bacterium]|nr:1,2-phenylacetyl-CoA epoxidase subunit A [Ardenticatenaceae bacterium]
MGSLVAQSDTEKAQSFTEEEWRKELEMLTHEEQLAEFEARIARGEKIEPGDWMPAEYRRQLIRMISQHAHSEVVGMLPEGAWITRAPNLRRKMVLISKVQDEGGHGQYLYHAAESLGISREEMLDALLEGRAKYSSIFNYPTLNWADIGVIGWLVDGAAIKNQTMLAQASYGPYSRAMVRICAEETFHHKQGKEMVIQYAQGTPFQRQMVQDSINRWWWPTLMMFGPHDSDSPNSETLIKWGIKTKTNDELRQEFINEMVADLTAVNLTLPDPDLHFDEASGNWTTGPIDWDEFWRVVKGNGPCNKERLAARQEAHENGRWVREAMAAFAARSPQVIA